MLSIAKLQNKNFEACDDYVIFAGYLLAEPNRVVGVRSLHSSLEKSRRKFACPGESITYTCSVYGSVLVWSTNGKHIMVLSEN